MFVAKDFVRRRFDALSRTAMIFVMHIPKCMRMHIYILVDRRRALCALDQLDGSGYVAEKDYPSTVSCKL